MLLFFSHPDRENINNAPHIPMSLKELLLPSAAAEYYSGHWGGCLTQHIMGVQYALYHYHFLIHERAILYPAAQKPVLALVYILKGNIMCKLHGPEAAGLREGFSYLFYLPERIKHEAEFAKGHYAVLQLQLSPALLSDLAADDAHIARLLLRFNTASAKGLRETEVPMTLKVYSLLHAVMYYRQSDGHLHTFMHEKIYGLLREYIKAGESPPPGESRPGTALLAEKLMKAKELVDRHEGRRLTIADISRKCFLNDQQLKTGFIEMFGVSLGQYQVMKRFEKALRLLNETDDAIHDIAAQVGYEEESSFTSGFRERYGMTPAAWRERIRSSRNQQSS